MRPAACQVATFGVWRIGSAFPWGGKGSGFDSHHPDHEKRPFKTAVFLFPEPFCYTGCMSDPIADLKKRILERPAARLLTDWFARLDVHGGIALDLGCGSGAEAEYLAKNGMMVDAIDKSDAAIAYTTERCQGLTVDAIQGDFREFELRPAYYSVVVAINSLPFLQKEECRALLGRIQSSLKPGGAVVLSVYGLEHAWANRKDMSFWLLEEFKVLWAGWEILAMNEYKGPWPLVSGEEIFQHRIHLVAKKPFA